MFFQFSIYHSNYRVFIYHSNNKSHSLSFHEKWNWINVDSYAFPDHVYSRFHGGRTPNKGRLYSRKVAFCVPVIICIFSCHVYFGIRYQYYRSEGKRPERIIIYFVKIYFLIFFFYKIDDTNSIYEYFVYLGLSHLYNGIYCPSQIH